MALGAGLDIEGLRVDLMPFVVGAVEEDTLFVMDEGAGCGGLSEPSGPSLSACAVSVVMSTIAIDLRRGFVNKCMLVNE